MFKPHQRHYLIGFLLDSAVMTGLTAMPFFIIQRLHGGAAMLGGISAAQALGYALLCFASQSFVTRTHHGLNWAVFGVALFAVFFCAAPLIHSPEVLAVTSTIGMLGMALAWPALHSWIGAEPDLALRGKRVSIFNMAWSLGFTAGPLYAGPLYSLDYRLPFALAFLLSGFTLALLLAAPHERDYFGEADAEALAARSAHDEASEVHLYVAWAANMVGNALAAASRNIFPKRIEDLVAAGGLHLFGDAPLPAFLTTNAAMTFSWLAFLMSGASAAVFFMMGRSSRWHHHFGSLAAIQVAAGIAMALLGWTHNYIVMALCCVVIGVNTSACFFTAVFYSLANARLKHRRTALNEAAVGVGGFVGSLGVGWFAGRYGMAPAFAGVPVVVIAVVALQFVLLRQVTRKRQTAPPA